MLNMNSWVTPNHFIASEFEQFKDLAATEEFDIVAPLAAYHFADNRYKKEATASLKLLKALGHPMVSSHPLSQMLEDAPKGLANRYNALLMAIVAEGMPDAEAFVDTYGAFGFRVGGETFMDGDNAGFFAYYMRSRDVLARLQRVTAAA